MFLFLSKLLPLFIYPLGLACLFLLVALVAIWKKPRIAAGAIALALVALFIGGNGWTTSALLHSLEWQNLPTNLPPADAIVVLGGGIKPPTPPRPGPDFGEGGDRIVYGAQLYRDGKAPWLILTGGRINWRQGGPPESSDMASIAQQLGVPKSAILEDPKSLNTYENAVNVKQILQAYGLKKVLLVTSAMHMPRSLLIFRRQNIEAIAAPTDFISTKDESSESGNQTPETILLSLVPDAGRLMYFTNAMKEYIGMVIYRLRGWL